MSSIRGSLQGSNAFSLASSPCLHNIRPYTICPSHTYHCRFSVSVYSLLPCFALPPFSSFLRGIRVDSLAGPVGALGLWKPPGGVAPPVRPAWKQNTPTPTAQAAECRARVLAVQERTECTRPLLVVDSRRGILPSLVGHRWWGLRGSQERLER